MTKLIPLTRGLDAIVDDDDYDLASQFTWYANPQGPGKFAAARRDPNRKTLYLHRVILDAPSGFDVDHINGNPLDNRRCNLRICTHRENMQNRIKRTKGVSQFKGVYPDRRCPLHPWQAQFGKGAGKSLGHFATEIEAARAYDAAALAAYGDFAQLNFPIPK